MAHDGTLARNAERAAVVKSWLEEAFAFGALEAALGELEAVEPRVAPPVRGPLHLLHERLHLARGREARRVPPVVDRARRRRAPARGV